MKFSMFIGRTFLTACNNYLRKNQELLQMVA